MGGKKKGGSSHTPVEAKETGRSFQIARILEVISEGEIYGLVNDMKSVYLDKTPLANADGTFNFRNISVYARSGSQVQSSIPEFNSVEKEIDVNTKILKNKPIIKTVTDSNVSRVRMTLGVERLLQQENNGDTNPTTVTMRVSVIKNGSAFSSFNYQFNGKYSSAYREMFYLNIPQAPFQIKVERLEPDSTTNKVQNNCFWSSYTEIIDENFTYPNTALVGIKIDSEYFNSIPTRNYEIFGLIVKIPNNYNPFTHSYTSDFWNGEFKLGWTNNPAWIFYDLVTNTRYGMGKRLAEFNIDKWQLYAIGRYCDELVPDGFGGKEPRMTCNMWVTDQRKAYELINDITSIFRAMPVWNGQALTAIQDRASDPVWTYNNANTIGGFIRQRSAKKARHNVIEVEYIDADDFYEKKVESVSDDDLIRRFGRNVKKVTAFGCTSRGQAYRTGRWILETEKLETETITFTVGQEGLMHLPYDVIEVADSQYAGIDIGGRILSSNGTKLTLDREIKIDDNSYLSYVSNKGVTENVKIVSFDKNTKIATVAKNLGVLPEFTVWGLTTKKITTGLYRAISIKENDNSEGKTFTITALQHVPQKEDIVINGTHFDPKPQTIYGDVIDADIKYNGTTLVINGKINGNFNPLSSNTIASYTVKLLKDGALVYIEKNLKSPDIKLDDLENGNYEAIIYAYNAKGQLLQTYTKTFKIDRPPLVTGIEIVGHLSSIIITWDMVDDTTQTEIWCSDTDDINSAKLVERIIGGYYSHEVGAKQVRYYWLRHVRGVNVGSFDQIQGRRGESGKDIKEELKLLNEELSKNIIDEIIDTALPARKLGMMLYGSDFDLNQYQGQKLIYDEKENKQYVWNGAKYVSVEQEILAEAIQGIIEPSQLAKIPTTKLDGKLTDAQLQSISATKLIGTIPIANVPTIPTNKLTGLITNNQIQQLDANKLTGNINIARVPNIPTNKLTGTIGDSQISQLSATKLTGVVGIDRLPNVPTSKLSGQVTANQISANAIGTNHLQAGAVTASKMVLYGENMILDPLFEDKSYWRENIISSRDCVWENGKITITITNKSTTSGTYFYGLRLALNLPLDKGRSYRLQTKVKVTGDESIANLQTSCYLTTYPNGLDRKLSTGWHNVGRAERYGAVDELLSCTAEATKINANHGYVGVYLRVGTRKQGDVITNATVEFSEIELIKMSDGELIVDGAISTNKLQANSVNTDKLASNSVSTDKLQANSVSTEKIKALAIDATKLAANSVTADKILANAITSVKIATNAVTTDKLSANAVTADKIGANAVTAVKIAGNSINANHLQAKAVTAGKIATGAVTAETVATNAITSEKISANAITAQKLAVNSVGANAIQANAVSADKLQANSVTSAKIQAGAVATNHLQAGAISTDKLAVGLGGNLLQNPIFANNGFGWTSSNGTYSGGTINREYIGQSNSDWYFKNVGSSEERLIKLRITENITSAKSQWADVCRQKIRLIPNQWYIFSAYVNSYRCNTMLLVEELNANGGYVKAIVSKNIHNNGSFLHGLDKNSRDFVKFRCPASGYVEVIVRSHNYTSSNPDVYVARPMLEECTEHTKEPSNWVNAGVTSIHGGSIATRTITADKLLANSITANELAVGSVSAVHIASNSISGDKLMANSISSEKIRANSITGTHIQANTKISAPVIEGGSIKGVTIEGATIIGAKIIGGTGDFTGDIVVKNQVGIKLTTLHIPTTIQNDNTETHTSRNCYWITVSPQQGGRKEICNNVYSYTRRYNITGSTNYMPSEQVVLIPENADVNNLRISPYASQTTGGRFVLNANVNYTIDYHRNYTESVNNNSTNQNGQSRDTIRIAVHRRFG